MSTLSKLVAEEAKSWTMAGARLNEEQNDMLNHISSQHDLSRADTVRALIVQEYLRTTKTRKEKK